MEMAIHLKLKTIHSDQPFMPFYQVNNVSKTEVCLQWLSTLLWRRNIRQYDIFYLSSRESAQIGVETKG